MRMGGATIIETAERRTKCLGVEVSKAEIDDAQEAIRPQRKDAQLHLLRAGAVESVRP